MPSDSPLSRLRTALRGSYDAATPPDPGTLCPRLALGPEAADQMLGGGLRIDGLHEIHAAGNGDTPAALGFALLIAHLRGGADGRPIVWARERRGAASRIRPYGPGLADLGIDPAVIALLHLPDGRAVLRAGLDAVRDGSASAVLIDVQGRQPLLDLTATRRLTLAAAETDTTALIVRDHAAPNPSAAHTRWHVAAAPSAALEADAPGAPAFALTLTRQRGGREGARFLLEWNRDTGCFIDRPDRPRPATMPLSGAVAAPATGRTGTTRRDRAA